MDELLQPARGRHHTERSVLGADQLDRGFDDLAEHVGQIEGLDDGLIRAEKRSQPALGGHDVLRLFNQIGQGSVELRTWRIGKGKHVV